MFSVPRFINPKASQDGSTQRRIVFVDTSLQGRLLIALICLESIMLIAALIYLYVKFSGIIEANLYTIHLNARAALLPLFFGEMINVILVMSFANTIALIAAHQLWGHQIKTTMASFVRRLRRFQAFDFHQAPEEPGQHKVLSLLYRWQKLEIGRIQQFKDHVGSLPNELSLDQDRKELQLQLQQCKALLQLKPLSNT